MLSCKGVFVIQLKKKKKKKSIPNLIKISENFLPRSFKSHSQKKQKKNGERERETQWCKNVCGFGPFVEDETEL